MGKLIRNNNKQMKFTSLVVALFIAGAAAFDKCDHLRAYVAPKAPGAVRLMVVGDRQVSGEGDGAVPTDEAVFTVPDLLDGSHWGHHGFPSALAKILKAKRPTIQWEVLNFGGIDYSVTGSFWESCDYEKSLNAEPDEHLDWLAGDKATANAAGGAKIAEVVYDSAIKLNNFRNHEKLYKIGRAVRQDPFV